MITNEIKEYAIKENIRQIKEALERIEYFLDYKETNSTLSAPEEKS